MQMKACPFLNPKKSQKNTKDRVAFAFFCDFWSSNYITFSVLVKKHLM